MVMIIMTILMFDDAQSLFCFCMFYFHVFVGADDDDDADDSKNILLKSPNINFSFAPHPFHPGFLPPVVSLFPDTDPPAPFHR